VRAFFATSLFVALFASAICWGASLAIYPGEQFVTVGRASYYQASNSADYPIAVVVEVTDWNIKEDGTEDNQATDELVVFPSRFVLKGKTMRKIRVSYRGKKALSHEKTYRVIIREVPVSFDKEERLSGIYMAISYRTACYVKPVKSTPRLTLVDAVLKGTDLLLTLENRGNAHQHIKEPILEIKDGAGRGQRVDDEIVGRLLTNKNLHAGGRRSFSLDLSGQALTAGKSVLLQCGEDDSRQKLNFALRIEDAVVETGAAIEPQEPVVASGLPEENLVIESQEPVVASDHPEEIEEPVIAEDVQFELVTTESSEEPVQEREFETVWIPPNVLFESKWLLYIDEQTAPVSGEDDQKNNSCFIR